MPPRLSPAALYTGAVFLLFGATAHAQGFSAGSASLRLEDGMTMQQVATAIGYRPSSAQETTCGANVGPGWTCRVWMFNGGLSNTLQVIFRLDGGTWVVNGWNVW